MRIHMPLCVFMLYPFISNSYPLAVPRELQLPGLIGDTSDSDRPADTIVEHITDKSSYLFSTSSSHTTTQSLSITSSTNTFQTHSTLGTSLATSTGPLSIDSSSYSTSSAPTQSNSPMNTSPPLRDAPSSSAQDVSQWKVIGIGVICVTLVGTVVLLIVSFDSWWNFLLALVGRGKLPSGCEDLLPDSEKRGWEASLANEDGHRYPTITSLESIVKSPTSPPKALTTYVSPVLPSVYCHSLDPHPLEPLFRRPSTRPLHPDVSQIS